MKISLLIGLLLASAALAQSGNPSRKRGTAAAPTAAYYADAPTAAVNVASVSDVGLVSKALTATAQDLIVLEAWLWIQNISGAARVYTYTCSFGSLSTTVVSASRPLMADATVAGPERVMCVVAVNSASLTHLRAQYENSAATMIIGGVGSLEIASTLPAVNVVISTGDETGAQTLALVVKSNNATATQTMTIESYVINHYKTNP